MNEHHEIREDETLPEFLGMVREAYQAGEAVDHFDLRSEDPASVEHFARLEQDHATAVAKLINFSAMFRGVLLDQLEDLALNPETGEEA